MPAPKIKDYWYLDAAANAKMHILRCFALVNHPLITKNNINFRWFFVFVFISIIKEENILFELSL